MKNYAAIATVILTATLPGFAAHASSETDDLPPGVKWRLHWSDEFDGTVLDRKKWKAFPEMERTAGFWSPDNISLDGKGNIVFRATLRDGKIVGGAMDTYRTFNTAYGYFTFRCKLPTGAGYRPAIWLTSTSVKNVGNEGKDGTEIDIMEQPSRSGHINMALHWDGYEEHHKTVNKVAPIGGPMDDWHTYAVWWKKDGYIFYIDGKEAWRTNAGGVSSAAQFIRIGIETPWPLEDSGRKTFNANDNDQFICDYARVYKEAD